LLRAAMDRDVAQGGLAYCDSCQSCLPVDLPGTGDGPDVIPELKERSRGKGGVAAGLGWERKQRGVLKPALFDIMATMLHKSEWSLTRWGFMVTWRQQGDQGQRYRHTTRQNDAAGDMAGAHKEIYTCRFFSGEGEQRWKLWPFSFSCDVPENNGMVNRKRTFARG